MKFYFPSIFSINENHESDNRIYHVLKPSFAETVTKISAYAKDDVKGVLIKTKGGEEILLVKENVEADFDRILKLKDLDTVKLDELASKRDSKSKEWIKHPILKKTKGKINYDKKQEEIRTSWINKFQFNLEEKNAAGDITRKGLRSPQLGAIHAILAHWSITKKIATVVLPTGVGKTETMLSTLIINKCNRLLVVVPTDALREQISDKFLTLGLLKEIGILNPDTNYPIVGVLKHKFKSIVQAKDFFLKCNVIVSTMNIVGQSPEQIQKIIVESCSHLFIDEAHHTEADTWKAFKFKFREKVILQFTATPFRNDGKEIDGKVIFEYLLSQAQRDGYYKSINFEEVSEYIPSRSDEEIAKKAIEILRRDLKNGFDHILMARVLTIARAEEVYEHYKSYTEFNPVQIHTGLSESERRRIKEVILNKKTKVIICVDMLGEGFDLPELKIAAFHDIRQSLPITIQIVGRFTRAHAKLGDPTIIANVADANVSDELIELYSYGADWNIILQEINFRKSEHREELWDFFKGFEEIEGGIPLQSLVPALSTVIYKTKAKSWNPQNFEKGFINFKGYDKVYSNINSSQNILILILGKRENLIWARLKEIYEWQWEMIIVYWNQDTKLLYINTTNNSSYYKKLAEAVIGNVELINGANVFRCFHGINRMKLKNVGLREMFGKLVSFIMRFGSDVERGMSEAQKSGMTKVVIMGSGFEYGEKVSAGCSLKGRIWYQRRNYINTLVEWSDRIGAKVTDDTLDPDAILKGTLKTEIISERPKVMSIGIDWPDEFYREAETAVKFLVGKDSFYLFQCGIELDNPTEDGDLVFALICEANHYKFKLNLILREGDLHDFEIKNLSGVSIDILFNSDRITIEEFFSENPPTIWFVDGSSLAGNILSKLPHTLTPYPKEKIEVWNWTGVDLAKESQGLKKEKDSIQRRVIDELIKKSYEIVFDDDDTGEIADVVTLMLGKDTIQIEFYHCKFSQEATPGARIKDLYEVCGQAQKSMQWMENPPEIIKHMLRREQMRIDGGKPSRIEKGNESVLKNFQKLSRNTLIVLSNVFVVQPGVSKAKVSNQQLELFAVTENYLIETRMVPFIPITSA